MIKILVADDHPIVRRGLRQVIAEIPDVQVTGEAGSSEEVLEKMRSEYFNMVILDISLPGIGGLNVLKKVREMKDAPAVLIVSFHTEEEYAIRAFKIGACGYLTKDSVEEELHTAIERILEGRKYVCNALADKLPLILREDGNEPPHRKLSDREYEIMCRIAQGEPLKAVASGLRLNSRTVSTYRGRILSKLNMTSNSELVRYVLDHHLLD